MVLLAALLDGRLSFATLISLFLGFSTAKFCGGKQEGKPGRVKSITFPLHTYEVHLHHWFLSSVASAICAARGFHLLTPGIFHGFLSGLIFHGVYCYNDWHRVIKRKAVDLPVEEECQEPAITV